MLIRFGVVPRLAVALAVLTVASSCGGDDKSAEPSPSAAAAEPAKPAISGRGNTTCVLTGTNPLTCWGFNAQGQLGIGTTENSLTPVALDSLGFGVRAFSAGEGATCAITTTGGVKCWGKNGNGQLGNGTTTDSGIPVDVEGLNSGVTALSSGVDHVCALLEGGAVKCWGANKYGQLGDGTTEDSSEPVEVEGLGEAVAIAADFGSTCAVTAGGAAKCWGGNAHGQLGNGTTKDSKVPVDVEGLDSGVRAIDANGRHACAVNADGGAMCWGSNRVGQLGDGSTDDSSVPVEVKGLDTGVASIATGSGHTCALTEDGAVKCWGFNEAGGLGNGSTKDSDVPVDVTGLGSGVVAITAGNAHSCALTDDDEVKCWGYNGYGGLGNNDTDNATRPVDLAPAGAPPEPSAGPDPDDDPHASHAPTTDHAGHGGS